MKLLYITNGINGSGGLERVLSIKASYFAEKLGYEVFIISLNGGHENPFYTFSPKIKMLSVEVGGNPLNYILAYKSGIQKLVNEVKPNVISVCDDGLKGFFLPSIVRSNAKWIYERHVSKLIEKHSDDTFIKNWITQIKWKLMDVLGNRFDAFVVLTNGNRQEWKSIKNLHVIPNPLPFLPNEMSTCENKVVICVGKISYQKGQDILLRAWEIVHTHHPDWELHLYGKENLFFLNTNQLQNNVYYFPPNKNIEKKLLESSIYVMSSRYEGFGMVLIEAMACGVPCISFDCDYGPGDIITNEVDGILVENQNMESFIQAIEFLIKNSDRRIQMGANAKLNVKRYQMDNIAKQWDQLFKSL